jgi:outer membrane receptor protein involved in Fe transport
MVPSLTLDYDLGSVATLKSISSYIGDATSGYTAGTGLGHRAQVLPTTTNAQFVRAGSVATTCGSTSSVTADGVCRIPVTGGVGPTALFIPGFPQRYAQLNYSFARRAITQELRLQSAPDSGRLSWLGGLFFTDVTYRQRLVEPGNEEQGSIFLRGVGEEWFMGTVNVAPDGTPLAVGQSGNHSFRDQTTKERETAAFGEASFSLTPALKLTGGLRYSKMEVNYLQYTSGSVFGNTNFGSFVGSPLAPTRITTPTAGHPFANQPGDPYYNIVSGKQSETPVSPKLGLAWQATPGDLFYATYSTGYRPGGVNQPAPPGNCAPALAALGITTTPLDFKSDTVRSYELGSKNRLGTWQVNTSAFYIKWINPQISQRITQCGHTYIDNAGAAVSKGMDVQIAGRLGPVTLTGAAAYTDAKYTQTVFLKTPPGAAAQIVARDGDTLGAPKWQFNASAQYDFQLADHASFVRADYQYAGSYFRTTGPGTVSYQAVTYNGESGRNFNARLGMNFERLEASVWASNLTNEDTVTSVGNTAPSVLVTETAVRPREIGVTLSYRY